MIKISVIVPCYNQAQYLDECLQSVLDQTYTDWECIIVNDGSPDNTEEVALQWVQKDKRFIYLKKENGGISNARNEGIKLAKGEWILPLDADDKISNDFFSLASAEFNKDYSIIYSKVELFGTQSGYWKLKDFSEVNIALNNCIVCTAFYKKSSWELVNGYDEKLIEGLEDWEFWISIVSKVSSKVHRINQTCFYYRIKPVSRNRTISKSRNSETVYLYIEKKHYDFYLKTLGGIRNNYREKINLKEAYTKLQKRYYYIEYVINYLKYLINKLK